MFDPTNVFILGGSTILIGIIMLIIGILIVRDQPPSSQRLTWHSLLKNSVHISLLDEEGKLWILNIHYNERITSPNYAFMGERKMQIQVPLGYSYDDFVAYVKGLELMDDNFDGLVSGVFEENKLKKLHFTKRDIFEYREFKKQFILKAFGD